MTKIPKDNQKFATNLCLRNEKQKVLKLKKNCWPEMSFES